MDGNTWLHSSSNSNDKIKESKTQKLKRQIYEPLLLEIPNPKMHRKRQKAKS
jgi:hypothetical protein